MSANTWKLQDAKARFSEVVRRARAGEPQQVTLHGEEAVVVVDPKRFDVRPKQDAPRTMAEFIEFSKKYCGPDLKIPPRTKTIPHVRKVFDESET
jgi:antitoxin Phd